MLQEQLPEELRALVLGCIRVFGTCIKMHLRADAKQGGKVTQTQAIVNYEGVGYVLQTTGLAVSSAPSREVTHSY